MKLAILDIESVLYAKLKSKDAVDKSYEELEYKVFSFIRDIIFYSGCGHYVGFTSTKSFRHQLYDKYKATRPSEKPHYFYQMLEAMIKEFGLVKVDGYEADGLCASCAKWCRINKIEYVVCNIDFDLQQIPGYHYTWDNKSHWNKEVFHVVNEYEAMYNLAKQFFKSQASDNIKVCKGVGDKAIVKILASCTTKFSFIKQIVNVYKNGFGKFKGYENYREMITLIYNLVYLKEDIEYDYQSIMRKV